MTDNKQNSDWGIYSIRKIIEYVLLFATAWQFGIPAANQFIDNRIQEKRDERKKDSKWLNELLVDEYGVAKDRLHIYMGDQNKKLNALYDTIQHIIPYVNQQMYCIVPRLIIKNNQEWWFASDGQEYRVYRSEDGIGSYFANGKWNYIFQ